MLLDDIAVYLGSQGVGTVGTDIFKGEMPFEPDNCIGLFEYAGSPPDATHDAQEIEMPGLQIHVRNKSYSAGREKIEAVISALNQTANQTLGNTFYLLIRANQSPESLGRDASDRAEFVVNFSIKKERG